MKGLIIVAFVCFGVASTASAGVPDPANCEVLPWDDYGDYGQAFMSPGTSSDSLADAVLIWVRDEEGNVCPGVHVEVDISACSNLCDDCPNGLNGITDEMGLVLLLPRVGGPEICDIKVWAGDVLIRTYGRVTSADWSISGSDTLVDGAVLVTDAAFFITHYPSPPEPYDWRHDYNADGVIDTLDYQMFGSCYLGTNFYECPSGVPDCELSPRCLDFGTVMLGDSLTREFTITNNSIYWLEGMVSETCDHYEIQSGYDPYFLEPESSLVVTVLFKPESADTHTCLIDTGAEMCSDLFCTGVSWEPSSCGVEPMSLDFDSVGVGYAKDMTDLAP